MTVPRLAASMTATAAAPVRTAPLARRSRLNWSYPAGLGRRDLRIDFVRGLAILFVVVDHIDIPSLYHLLSHQRMGVVSGAELFVALSGIVLGMVHRRRAIEEGWSSAAHRMWSRALLLYLTYLTVMVAAYATSFLPFLNGNVLTTWTDNTTGTVYSMYGTTPLLADYPVPPSAVFDILFLNIGPYQFNVIGLYIVLLALAPLALRLLLANRWWVILGVSWAVAIANSHFQIQAVPSQFNYQFPLLSWQVLFFTGLVVGFNWTAVIQWFDRPLGRTTVLLAVLLSVGFAVFAWNSPALSQDPFAIRLHMIPDATYWRLYASWFERDFLGLLRIVNVAALLIVLYGLLTKCWYPLNRLFGWFLVPLGGATLYVFILHLPFTFLAGSLPILAQGNIWINTLAHTLVLALLWLMVKREVLFRWIPR